MLVPFQLATSSRTLVVASETSETWPPMIPAIPDGPVLVADEDGLGVEAALLAVEGRHRLALLGGAHRQRPVRHLVEVEGVQRLRGEQHHVVGDVDDVVDRPLAGGGRAAPAARRRGPDRHVGEDAGGESRAEIGYLDRDRGAVGHIPLTLGRRVLGPGLGAERRRR